MKEPRWLLIALLAFTLTGCLAGSRLNDGSPSAAGQWSCSGSVEDGTWNCVELSANNQPSTQSNQPIQSSSPESQHEKVADSSLENSNIRVHPYEPSGNPGFANTAGDNTNAYNNAIATLATEETEEPEYLWLSYRPDTPTRIEDLPDRFFAVQLAAFSNMKNANEYAENQSWLTQPRGVRISTGEKTFYVILLGIYESRTRAERAARSISKHVKDKPWIRSMSSLKPAIERANREAGNASL